MISHSRQLPHRVTTRHLGAAYPFMAEAGLGDRGVQLGVDLFGGPFLYDPWELYTQGLLSNPNTLVIGEVGTAVRDEDGLGILRICAAAFVRHSLLSRPDVRRIVV